MNRNINLKIFNKKSGFSLVELLVVVVFISIFSVFAYVGISHLKSQYSNMRVENDLQSIASALEYYKKDHFGLFPVPEPGKNMNVLCFNADTTYAHDCNSAIFRQAMIDTTLLPKRFSNGILTDPRTDSRYVYGVTNDGRSFQVAGIVMEDGEWKASSVESYGKGFPLISLIRAYNNPNFVVHGEDNLPYSPDHLIITATLQNMSDSGKVTVTDANDNSVSITSGMTVYTGYTVTTTDSTLDIYYSDGSVSTLSPDSELTILDTSKVEENDKDNIVTRIYLKLTNGKIWNKVARLASKSEFNIETNSAIAGVRGTEFGVEIDSSHNQTIKVLTGSVEAKPAIGDAIEVTTEKEVTVEEGGTASSISNLQQSDIDDIKNTYYDKVNIHNGMVPYILSMKPLPDDSAEFIITFNSYSVERKVLFDGIELFDSPLFGDNTDLKADADDSAITFKDSDPNDSSGLISFDTTRNAYRLVINKAIAEENADRFAKGIKLRAYRCLDNSCSAKDYSSFSTWIYDYHGFGIDLTQPTMDRETAPKGNIIGLRNLVVDQSAAYTGSARNLRGLPEDAKYGWVIEEQPYESIEELRISDDKKTATFKAETPGFYVLKMSLYEDTIKHSDGFMWGYSRMLIEVTDDGTCSDTGTITSVNVDPNDGLPKFTWDFSPACTFVDADTEIEIIGGDLTLPVIQNVTGGIELLTWDNALDSSTYNYTLSTTNPDVTKKGSFAITAPTPPPVITSPLVIDCSGICLSGNTYPVGFTVTNADTCSAVVALESGTGTVDYPDYPSIGLTGFDYNTGTGSEAGDKIKITVTCTGSSGDVVADIPVYIE